MEAVQKSSEAATDVEFDAQFQVTTKIGRIPSKQDERASGCVMVTPRTTDGVFLTATDGRVLAIVPVPGAAREETLVNLRPVRRFKLRRPVSATMREGQVSLGDTTYINEVPKGRYPDVHQVVNGVPEGTHVLTFDLKYLIALAKAIAPRWQLKKGEQMPVTLVVPARSGDDPGNEPIPVIGGAGIGVLMPLARDEGEQRGLIDLFNNTASEYRTVREAARK